MKQVAQYDNKHIRFIIQGPYSPELKQPLTKNEREEVAYKRFRKLSVINPKKAKLMRMYNNITDKQYEALEILSGIPPFDKPNIIDHMISHQPEWDRFIYHMDEHPNPTFPGTYT